MQKTLSTLKDKINNALVVDRENHIYRCHRSIFTDQQLFDFEMKHIFEGNWVFLAHESQIAEPGDYYTSWPASLAPFSSNWLKRSRPSSAIIKKRHGCRVP